MNQNEVEIAHLLDLTGRAHHRAYIDTDGYDPDWPIWYADYSIHQIRPLLEGELSKSEYIYALVHLSKIQPIEAPNEPWPKFYARYLLREYSN